MKPFLFIILLTVFPATAQEAAIGGVVSDPAGLALPGATVTIKNVETGSIRTLISDGAGRYSALGLGEGQYQATAAKERRLDGSSDPRLQSLHVNAFDAGLMPATDLARTYSAPLRFVSRYVLPALSLFRSNVHSPTTSGRRLALLASRGESQSFNSLAPPPLDSGFHPCFRQIRPQS